MRMPTSFFPSRYRSFIHLMFGWAPQAAWMPRRTATAAQPVRENSAPSSTLGRSSRDRYSPSPRGEAKLRPRVPRPPVCSSASRTVPSAAPWAAMAFSRVLVESTWSSVSTLPENRLP